jgi:hypothetical protein
MTATARDSTLYGYEALHYVPDGRDRGSHVVPYYFEMTIVSASGVGDTYNLFTLLARWSVAFLHCTGNGVGASAGSSATVQIGDSGDDDRYMPATDLDASNAQYSGCAYAGVAYRPTANTVVVAKNATAAWSVGKIAKGHFFLVAA